MKLSYYPGCTLKTSAKHFEESAFKVMEKLGHPMQEMENWICCGTVFSMTTDDLMLQLSAIRNLLRAEEQNIDELVVLCSMCYNTLRRAKKFITADEENLATVNDIMYDEDVKFSGRVKITQLLQLLKEKIGYDTIAARVEKPLAGLKAGAYYGCLLVRPQEFTIDPDFEDPSIMEDLITVAGGEGVAFPLRLECCGAYQTVKQKEITAQRTFEIISSARKAGCETVITSCPLCAFNLDQRQKEVIAERVDFRPMPVFYVTELLSVALGGGWNNEWKKLHYVDPEQLLREKNLIK